MHPCLRAILLPFLAMAVANCAVVIGPIDPWVLPPGPTADAAWVGVLDAWPRPSETGVSAKYSGRIEIEALDFRIEQHLKEAGMFSKQLRNVTERANTERGLIAISDDNPDMSALVFLEILSAEYDVERWKEKLSGIAIPSAATLMIAYPFLTKWERQELAIPVRATAEIHVFARDSRMSTVQPIEVSEDLLVQGLPWGKDRQEQVLEAAKRLIAVRLSERIADWQAKRFVSR